MCRPVLFTATVDQACLAAATAAVFVLACNPAIAQNDVSTSQAACKQASVPITPFTGLRENYRAFHAIPPNAFSDAYTRIVITSTVASITDIDIQKASHVRCPVDNASIWNSSFDYRSRQWLERYLVAKEFLVNINLKVSANQFKATIPIATFDHKSSAGQGEQWDRKIYHTVEAYPLFLVGATGEGGTPNLDLEFNGNDSLNSQIAASAVSAVFDVAKELGPQAKIVTSLSQSAIEKQATVLDSAISKLFGKSVSEGHQTDADLRYATYGSVLEFAIKMPATENSFSMRIKNKKVAPIPVGTWSVSFEEPRPSVFVDWRICGVSNESRCKATRSEAVQAVYKDVDAATVLRTALSSTDNGLGQVSAYLSQLDWYKAAIPKLSTVNVQPEPSTKKAVKGAAPKANDASNTGPKPDNPDEINSEFCLKINNTMTQLGLSSVDAGIVVWAVYSGMPDIPQNARSALASNSTCSVWINRVTSAKSVSKT